jgi:DNA-binding SARP family transcriptional activator/tetratricopeptide (TPR) repeat protein
MFLSGGGRRLPTGQGHVTNLLRFTVLGPVRAMRGAAEVALGSPQQRTVLAVLLVRYDSPVPVEELVDAVWGEQAPASAVASVRTYVHRLRRLLADSGSTIRSVGKGYMMETSPDELDLTVFRARLADAAQARRGGDHRQVVSLLRGALERWQGSALADLSGSWAEAQRTVLDQSRRSACELLFEAELELGDHQNVVADLTSLIAEHPLDERFRELLMLALYRSGRPAAALGVFHETRELLAEELGVDPSAALRSLHERMLRADETLLTPAATPVAPVAATAPAELDVPTQLPLDLPTFTGREAELARLHAGGPVIVVAGTAGVGKTAFALHGAHQLATRFPDGQIYLDLRGFDAFGPPLTTSHALGTVLAAFGVPVPDQPQDLDAQAALYRSLLTGRRVLLLLDNARDSRQVRPLLPGGGGCMAIVTSRNQLSGLVARDGAQHIRLGVLSPAEALDMLDRRLGTDRVAAEPPAVEEIIRHSARLPLALALIAARAAVRPTFPLSAVAAELRESPLRLDVFSDADGTLDIRSVFSSSYQALSDDAARLLRLLAAPAGPDVSLAAIAALAGQSVRRVRAPLAELTESHLVTEQPPGRYAPHDLLRTYAAELHQEHDAADERRVAVHRILSHYLHTSYAAVRKLSPNLPVLRLAPIAPGVTPEAIADRLQALRWFRAEQSVLVAAVEHAAESAFETHSWQLAWTLMEFLQRSGCWRDQIATQRTALDAALRGHDMEGQAHAHRNLARVYLQTDQYQNATAHLRQALALFERLGDAGGQLGSLCVECDQ